MSALPSVKFDVFALGGGLDLTTPGLSVKPGRLRAGVNVEPGLTGGYRRIAGFERADGRLAPSAAILYSMTVADGSAIAVDTTITGATSGATARVIAKAGNILGLTAVTIGFIDDEPVGATTVTEPASNVFSIEESVRLQWQLAAENYYRGLIAAAPGTGPLRGLWQRGSTKYAWRDSGAVCKLYRSTAGGWTEVPTNPIVLAFDAGATEFIPGDSINGETSGATGTVHRIVVWEGDWGTTDARGYVVLTDATGTFADGENIRIGTDMHAVADGAGAAHEQSAGGLYRHMSHNFYGGASSERTYGVDGANPAFEIDENHVFSPILMPANVDGAPQLNRPHLVAEHRGHLFLAFAGGSVQHSIPGEPLVFNGFLGSAEFGLGYECTGLESIPGGALVMTTRRNTHALYGSGVADWEKKIIATQAGAAPGTLATVATTYMLDDSGIMALDRVQAFGDFQNATISEVVQPLITVNQDRVIGVVLVRKTNQYRVVYDNGRCLVMHINAGGKIQFTEIDYGVALSCCAYAKDANEQEVILLGGADGFVYQAERGTSFDGNAIEMILQLPFVHSQSAPVRKRYLRGELEIDAYSSVALQITSDLNYSSGETAELPSTIDTPNRGGQWDVDSWDQFFWDGQGLARPTFDLRGSGPNITLSIYHSSAVTPPFILQSVILHYLLRRVQRGSFRL